MPRKAVEKCAYPYQHATDVTSRVVIRTLQGVTSTFWDRSEHYETTLLVMVMSASAQELERQAINNDSEMHKQGRP